MTQDVREHHDRRPGDRGAADLVTAVAPYHARPGPRRRPRHGRRRTARPGHPTVTWVVRSVAVVVTRSRPPWPARAARRGDRAVRRRAEPRRRADARARCVRRVPVVDDGRPVGIVSPETWPSERTRSRRWATSACPLQPVGRQRPVFTESRPGTRDGYGTGRRRVMMHRDHGHQRETRCPSPGDRLVESPPPAGAGRHAHLDHRRSRTATSHAHRNRARVEHRQGRGPARG